MISVTLHTIPAKITDERGEKGKKKKTIFLSLMSEGYEATLWNGNHGDIFPLSEAKVSVVKVSAEAMIPISSQWQRITYYRNLSGNHGDFSSKKTGRLPFRHERDFITMPFCHKGKL